MKLDIIVLAAGEGKRMHSRLPKVQRILKDNLLSGRTRFFRDVHRE